MDPQKKKKVIMWIVIGCILVAGLILGVVFWAFPRGGAGTTPGSGVNPSVATGGITQVTSPKSAYDVAASRAKQWEPDAALMEVNLGNSSGGQWMFIFVSQKNKGKGFQVVVDGQEVSSANEIAFEGSGTPLPANIISPDAVMAQARSIPGYGTVAFVSLEMIYNAAAKQWYWGIKTSNGTTLTIKATP